MPAVSSGGQIDEAMRSSSCSGLSGASWISTGTGPPSAAARGRVAAAPGGGPSAHCSTRRPASLLNLPSLPEASCSIAVTLLRMVSVYCGRLAPMRTTCRPMAKPTAPSASASVSTATPTEAVGPRPIWRSRCTHGATSRLRMIARVIGISTSRPKYSRASTVAAPTMPDTPAETRWVLGSIDNSSSL